MSIDLNADVGESFGAWRMGDDAALLDLVTSASVACGFHAGDPSVMLATCDLAVSRGVAVGAHPSYRDLAGFGRRFMDVAPRELAADVLYQVSALAGMAAAAGTRVSYVKPHGALYAASVTHSEQAAAVVAAVAEFDTGLAVLCLPGSALSRAAERRGLRVVAEAFADRAYSGEGTLVPRGTPGAVLEDAHAIAERVVRLVTEGRVRAVDGSDIEIAAESVCIHGDTPGAVAIARRVRERLAEAGVEVAPFR